MQHFISLTSGPWLPCIAFCFPCLFLISFSFFFLTEEMEVTDSYLLNVIILKIVLQLSIQQYFGLLGFHRIKRMKSRHFGLFTFNINSGCQVFSSMCFTLLFRSPLSSGWIPWAPASFVAVPLSFFYNRCGGCEIPGNVISGNVFSVEPGRIEAWDCRTFQSGSLRL